MRPTLGAVCAALIFLVAAWVLRGFLEALLASSVIAVASWPLYRAFDARMPRRLPRAARSAIFVTLIATFVLVPLMLALVALVAEAHATLLALSEADRRGIGAPAWLAHIPLAGPWLQARWLHDLARPGALSVWVEQADPAALLSWAKSLGQFTLRHLFIVAFTVLLLFFHFQNGEALWQALRAGLRERVGAGGDRYLEVARDTVRSAVESMLLVGLFAGLGTGLAYGMAGVPHAPLWGAITGALGLVPFLGYVAVAALALQLAMAGAGATATASLVLGAAVLFTGDKVVRPAMGQSRTRLPYVWMLMACLGGFGALGLVGLVVGPVAVSLSRELLADHVLRWTPR